MSDMDTQGILTEFLNTFDRVNKTSALPQKLDMVCESIVSARLFRRAIIAFYERRQGEMCLMELGAAGIKASEIERIRENFHPVSEELWLEKFRPEFMIGRSYFIPVEADFDTSKGTHILSEISEEEFKGDWHPDDRLFIPLHDLSGNIIGILSVDDPFDGCRPTGESLNILELYANLVSGVINEFMLLDRRFRQMCQKMERAAQELSESEEKYRLIAENIAELVYLQSLDGTYEYVSPSVERLLGYTVQEYCKVEEDIWVEHSVFNERARTIRESVRQSRFAGIPVYYLELVCKDGRKVILEIREEILFRQDNDPAVLGVARDVTERFRMDKKQREMELDLLNLSKLSSIGMLTSGLAHNLNSPLQAIQGYAEILKKKHPEMGELTLILKGVEKMSDIITNLMSKSRMDQDRRSKPLDLNKLLEQELKFLEADLEYKRNVKKTFKFAPESLMVTGVYSDFSQSFSAIFRNALDAMWDSKIKQLEVTTRLESDWIHIDVTDTGCGIAPEDTVRIFQPFFTTKPMLTDRHGSEPVGTGIGLASAQQLLSKYGGEISVDSGPNQGTTFSVRVPLNATLVASSESETNEEDVSWQLPESEVISF